MDKKMDRRIKRKRETERIRRMEITSMKMNHTIQFYHVSKYDKHKI